MNGFATSRDGVGLAYEERGEGTPALVFVHGWCCDRSYWKHQLDHFAGRHRVVALDLAGHGESGGGRTDFTMRSFGADVAAVVDQLDLQQVVLIGHSMGVDVIVEAALKLPDRVSGLILVDQYKSLGRPRTREQTEELVRPFRGDFVSTTRTLIQGMFLASSPVDVVEWVVDDISIAPADVALSALEQTWSNDGPILANLPMVTAPMVAINSERRPTDFAALSHYGLQTLIAHEVGHFMMLEDPESFNRLLEEAIQRVAAANSRG